MPEAEGFLFEKREQTPAFVSANRVASILGGHILLVEIFPLLRKLLIAVCSFLLAVGSMIAQEAAPEKLPDAPAVSTQTASPAPRQDAVVFHKKVFWSLVAADAASAVADAQTSWQNEQMYPTGHEQNSWLYGRNPSLGRYYATFAVIDGGGAFLSYKLLHARRESFRMVGWALLAGLIGQHSEGWIYNVSVRKTVLTATPGT